MLYLDILDLYLKIKLVYNLKVLVIVEMDIYQDMLDIFLRLNLKIFMVRLLVKLLMIYRWVEKIIMNNI